MRTVKKLLSFFRPDRITVETILRTVWFVGVRLGVAVAILLAATASHAAGEPTPQELVDSVVKLEVPNVSRGSGVVVSKLDAAGTCRVLVLTARHVATEETPDGLVPEPRIELGGVRAASISMHKDMDLATVLYVFPKSCTELPYRVTQVDTRPLIVGDVLVHVGYSRGRLTYAAGLYINTTERLREGWSLVGLMTIVAGPGSSGGAIFRNGQLVGILVGGEQEPPFRNVFIPIQYALPLIS